MTGCRINCRRKRRQKRLRGRKGQLLKGLVACDKGFQLILQLLDVTERFQARRVMIRFAF